MTYAVDALAAEQEMATDAPKIRESALFEGFHISLHARISAELPRARHPKPLDLGSA